MIVSAMDQCEGMEEASLRGVEGGSFECRKGLLVEWWRCQGVQQRTSCWCRASCWVAAILGGCVQRGLKDSDRIDEGGWRQ